MARRKRKRSKRSIRHAPDVARREEDTDRQDGKLLVPVFTAVTLLIIAAAVAVVMTPDKRTTPASPEPLPDSELLASLPPEPTVVDSGLPADAAPEELVRALEMELARKERTAGPRPQGCNPDPRNDPLLARAPVPGLTAKAVARRLTNEPSDYVAALRAIAEQEYDEARDILDPLIEALPEAAEPDADEQARLYVARADADFFDCRYDEAVQGYRKALQAIPDAPYIRYSLARALIRTPPPGADKCLIEAIQILAELETKAFDRKEDPLEWGLAKLALGVAFWNLRLGDPAVNRHWALTHNEEALEALGKEDFPAEWARTQTVLGRLYKDLPDGDRAENLAKAMEHYRRALEVVTQDAFPQQFSVIQANIADAYANLPTGDVQTNQRMALHYYEQALSVPEARNVPAAWASAMIGMGTVYSSLRDEKLAENLGKAIRCYQAALTVYTKEAYPTDWATVQNNLGNTHIAVATMVQPQNWQDHIEKAIRSLESAAAVLDRSAHPVEWASAQYNLGVAYRARVRGDRKENLERAEAHFASAVLVFTTERFPDYSRLIQQTRDQVRSELDSLTK